MPETKTPLNRYISPVGSDADPSPPRTKTTTLLGIYLLITGIYQIVIGAWAPSLYLDSHLGLKFLVWGALTAGGQVLSFADYEISLSAWPLALWALYLGVKLIFWGKMLKTYIVSEILLSSPTPIMIIFWLVNPTPEFPRRAVLIPWVIFFVFSVVPVWLAVNPVYS